MEDIRSQDQKLFLAELIHPRMVLPIFGIFFLAFLASHGMPFNWALSFMVLFGGLYVFGAHRRSIGKRWRNPKYRSLWMSVEDRLLRFDDVVKSVRDDRVSSLEELPKTIHRIGDSLYGALRRGDIIIEEVSRTEGTGLYGRPTTSVALSADPQAKELYRIADKNIAEYRQQFDTVLAGVQRAEAQCHVFMTTLDTLRMKMIGHRLVGRSPEMSSMEFLSALNEAKLQLQAIDKALDELDFTGGPRMIAAMPPPVTADLLQENRIGGGPEA